MERDDPAGPGALAGAVAGTLTGGYATAVLVSFQEETTAALEAELAAVGADPGSVTLLFWVSVMTALAFVVGLGLVVGSLLGVAYDWLGRPGVPVLAGFCLAVGLVAGFAMALPVPRTASAAVVAACWVSYVPVFTRLYEPEEPRPAGR